MKDDKGFTLIEVVIAIGILAAIILSIMSFYVSGVKGFARETTTASNQTKVRRASNDISRELRRAYTVAKVSGNLVLDYSDGKRIIVFLEDTSIKMSHYTKEPSGSYTYNYTNILAKDIILFDVNVNAKNISFKIESSENSEGLTYELESKITIRS